jgi:DtxR family Mn-dependent transcriptional regulator
MLQAIVNSQITVRGARTITRNLKRQDAEAWLTPSVEDFLKAVYHLQQEGGSAATTRLADELGIAPSSVTDMIKRLACIKDEGIDCQDMPEPLLEYKPYHGARLTDAGERVALRVIRRHRLIELLLYRVLNYSWDEVHEEAERIEHAVSSTFVERLSDALGKPDLDPHGDPIPNENGALPSTDLVSLDALKVEQGGTIVQIRHQEPETLRSLAQLGLVPGEAITVVEHNPLTDTFTLKLGDGKTEVISTRVAEMIAVKV